LEKSDSLILKTDVLIVGGGGAGMRAAIEAASQGCEVIVANKGPVGRSGTTPMAMEAYQAVCYPGDTEERHFRDTVEGGRFLGDETLIEILVSQAVKRAGDLEAFGVRFKKKPDGSFDPMHHPGQSFPRTLFIQGGGFGLLMGLVNESRKYDRIRILSDVTVVKFVQDQDGAPSAAVLLDLKDGALKAIQCKAVVIATGGYEELWARNDAASTACGDGLFLAYEAGAELVDLEMLQFYPTVVIHPAYLKGTLFQYELIIHPDFLGGRLLNGEGKTFFEGMPLRDAITRSIWKEIKKGRGTEHGGVHIDLTRTKKDRQELTAALEKWQPNQFHYLQSMGIDLRDTLLEVGPHVHYNMGGVAIDEKGATTVPGLFAAGEAAGNLQGANRVSGNALAETQVFGAITGASAARFAKERDFPEKGKTAAAGNEVQEECRNLRAPKAGGLRPFQVRRRLREAMWKNCGVEREAEGLRQGRGDLETLRRDLIPALTVYAGKTEPIQSYPLELQDAWEVKMMAGLADLVLSSALTREESRGHHNRTDFPETEKEPRHIFVSRRQGLRFGKVKRAAR
jgi:succinate dehydrogenase/fumarate reductase flavoprotein subunit